MVDVITVENAKLGEFERLETAQRILEVVPPVPEGDRLAQALVDEDPRAERRDETVVPLAHGVVAVAHPQLGHRVEKVLAGVRRVDVRRARIRPHAKESDPARRLEVGVELELVFQSWECRRCPSHRWPGRCNGNRPRGRRA